MSDKKDGSKPFSVSDNQGVDATQSNVNQAVEVT